MDDLLYHGAINTHCQERDDAAFSLPFVHARLPDGDEYPAGAVPAGCCGRVGAVAPDVLILVVMGACGRPARRGDIKRVIRLRIDTLNRQALANQS